MPKPEVVLVRWPDDGPEGARLASFGVAVLYLVGPDSDPPMPTTCIEDWVRVPGDDRDLSARVAALELRSRAHDAPPRVDSHGRLHFHGNLVPLAPLEAQLAGALTAHFGEVVADEDLSAIVSAGTVVGSELSLRAQMAQLRSRLRDIGLAVHRSRRRGYRLSARGTGAANGSNTG